MKLNPALLMKLIQLIDESSNLAGNEWALLKLKDVFSKNSSDTQELQLQNISKRLQQIEQYLSLDTEPKIDYSDFPEDVGIILFRDCIVMSRFESGLANHSVDFLEFCRYAHKQLEGMLNFFM